MGRGYRVYRIFTASSLGLDVKDWDRPGERGRKSLDKWDCLGYISTS